MAALRRPLVLVPLALLALLLLFVAFGFLAAPLFVRSAAQDYVAAKLPRTVLSLGAITVNPLDLSLEIRDIAIASKAEPNEPMAAAARLYVNASILSLLTLSPRLDSVEIERPMLDAVLRRDGALNLAELLPPETGEPTPEMTIARLTVTGGEASFTDMRHADPLTKSLTPISFTLNDFETTSKDGGGFKLDAAGEDGETFHWDGNLAMAPLASAGHFRIDRLRLTALWKFVADLAPVAVTAGTLDMAGRYALSVLPAPKGAPAPQPALDADIASFALDGLAARTARGETLAVATLRTGPTHVSLGQDRAALGEVTLTGLAVAQPDGARIAIDRATVGPSDYRIRGQAGTLGAVALAGISGAIGKVAVSLDSASLGSSQFDIAAQRGELGAAALAGARITAPAKRARLLMLARLELGPSSIDAKACTAALGAVLVSGVRAAATVAADNSISVPGLWPLPLPKVASRPGPPWKASVAGFTVEDAALRLNLARVSPARLVEISSFSMRAGAIDADLAGPVPVEVRARINRSGRFSAVGKVEPRRGAASLALDLERLDLLPFTPLIPSLPPGIAIASGTAGAKGRLEISPARSGPQIAYAGDARLSDFAITQKDGEPLVSWAGLDLVDIRYRPQSVAIARVVFDRPNSFVTIGTDQQLNLASVTGGAPAVPAARVTAVRGKKALGNVIVDAPIAGSLVSAGTVIPIEIGAMVFKDGTIHFADYSIEPNFAAKIQGFSGTITALSTKPGSLAKFDLKGFVVDRYSPVSITGSANPFAYDANTDVTAVFGNIELPVFNPYSGRYAGYAIAKGKLTTTLHYRINNRALNADHHVIIDQLEWGEATDSKEKVSLPVRMAASLLKDRNGVIDLNLPVSGTLDDPKFRIWPVVWQIVGNVLTKIVTAPFALIGSLFEGADKAQFVAFAPGSAELPADAGPSLSALAKGLADRPSVNLDIPAGPGIAEDAAALRQANLAAAVLAAGKNKAGASYATLDAGTRVDRMKGLYRAKFGKKPDFPKDLPKANLLSSKEAKAAAAAAEEKWLTDALLPKFEPSEAQLAELGQARADAVKQALLKDGAIDPGRVFVAGSAQVAQKDGKVTMELAVR